MKVVFFADIDGYVMGFCPRRDDGKYPEFIEFADDEGDPPVHIIDVVECRTFNDAKRHRNLLAGWDPDEGVDDFGDFDLEGGP